jgi:hypothetical protein
MARRIGDNVINELTVEDKAGGGSIVIYYRFPTTEERIEYGTAQFQRERDKIIMSFIEARHVYGYKIILGIRKGDLLIKKAEGFKPLCTDQKDPDFEPEWKEIVKKDAPDLLEGLCIHAFGIPDVIASQMVKEGEYSSKN